MTKGYFRKIYIIYIAFACSSFLLAQQKTADDLAKQLNNPVASLISVPFQFNFDFNINSKVYGGDNGYKMLLNFQPVIPMSIAKKWNLINRVIVPIITQKDVTARDNKEEGIGDILYTGFLSPKTGKIIWGIGPALSIPTATNNLLGLKKLIIGPSLVVLAQPSGWTIGGLFTQSWSVAGDEERPDISSFYAQPFILHGFTGGFTFGVTSENSYDWKNKRLTSGMVSLQATQVIKLAGKQLASIGLAPKYFFASSYVKKPEWGARVIFVLIFPK